MFSMRQQQNKPEPEKKQQPVLVGCTSTGVNPRHASLVASDYNYSDDDLASPARSPDSESKKSSASDDKATDSLTKSDSDLLCSTSDATSRLPSVSQNLDPLSAIPKIDIDLPEILLEDDVADPPPPPPPPTDTIDLAAEAAKVASTTSLAEDEDSNDMSVMIPENLTEEEVGMIIGISNPTERSSSEVSTSKVSSNTTPNKTEVPKQGAETEVLSDVTSSSASQKDSQSVVNESTLASNASSSHSSISDSTVVEADHASEAAVPSKASDSSKPKSVPLPSVEVSAVTSKTSASSKVQSTSNADSITTSRVGITAQRVHLQHTPALVPVSVITTNAPRLLTPVSPAGARPGAPRVGAPRLMTAVMPGSDVYKLTQGQLSSPVVISPRKITAEEIQGSPVKTSQDIQSPSKQKSPVHLSKQTPVLILRPNPGVISQQTPIQVLQKTPVQFLQQQGSGARIPKQILVQIPKSQHPTQVQIGSKQLPVLVAQHASASAAAPATGATAQPPNPPSEQAPSSSSAQLSEQESINLLEKTTVQILQPTAASKKYEALLEAMERIHEGSDSSNLPESLELQSPIDSEVEQEANSSTLATASHPTSLAPQSSGPVESKQTPESTKATSSESRTKVLSEPVFEGLGTTLLQVSLSQSEQKSRIIMRPTGSTVSQSASSFVSGSPKLASLLGAPTDPIKTSAKRELLPDLNEAAENVDKGDKIMSVPSQPCEVESPSSKVSPASAEAPVANSSSVSTPTSIGDRPLSSEADKIESSPAEDKSIDEKPVSLSGRRSSQDITITSATDSDSTLTAMTLPPNIRQITSTIYSQSSAERRSPSRPQSQPSPAVTSLQTSQVSRSAAPSHSSSAPGSPLPDQADNAKTSTIQAKAPVWNGDKKCDSDYKQNEQVPVLQGSPSKKQSRSQSTPAIPISEEADTTSSQPKSSSGSIVSKLEAKPSLLQAQLLAGFGKSKEASPSLSIGPPPPYPASLKEESQPQDPSQESTSTSSELIKNIGNVKEEPMDVDEESPSAASSVIDVASLLQPKAEKDDSLTSKLLAQPTTESQNVLLKQLLQNTACAASTSQPSKEVKPSLTEVPSLEAQLARPVPPTPSALIPPLLTNDAPPRPRPITPSKSAVGVPVSPSITTANSVSISALVGGPSVVSTAASSSPVSTVVTTASPSQPAPTPMESSGPNIPSVTSQAPIAVSSEGTVVTVSSSPVVVSSSIPTTSAAISLRQPTPPVTSVAVRASGPPTPAVSSTTPVSEADTPSAIVCGAPPVQSQSATSSLEPELRIPQPPTSDVAPSVPLRTPLPQGVQVVQGRVSQSQLVQPVQSGIPSQQGMQTQQSQTVQAVMATQAVMAPQAGLSQAPGLQVQPNMQRQSGLPVQARAQIIPPGASKGAAPFVQQTVPLMGSQGMPQGGQHVAPSTVLSRGVLPGHAPGVMPQGQMAPTVIKREVSSEFEAPSTSTAPNPTPMDIASQKAAQEQAAIELKKLKRRQYQQKRRQSQGKESGTLARKRMRRLDEDYDSCMESIMIQLRQLPPMTLRQPQRCPDYAVCCVYGSGNLAKVTTGCRTGDLQGSYGCSTLKSTDDFYATQPYGDDPPVPQPFVPTKANFYHLDIGLLELEDPDEKKHFFRDNDTPDTVISSSSPECVMPEKPLRFPGLRLIEDDLSDEEEQFRKRASPVIPIIAPIPIRLKPGNRDTFELDKENAGMNREPPQTKARFGGYTPFKDTANLSVTITISDTSAENICGVLIDLANVLNIAAPTSYQIVDRTGTPPTKLGLYRCKSKDGKESDPVDIQTILNGAAKFCHHCDVVILNNGIRKRASEIRSKNVDFPFSNGENDDVYFCSSTCYMQSALMHRSPNISHEKAAALVDHVIQAPSPPKRRRLSTDDEKSRGSGGAESGDVEMKEGDPTGSTDVSGGEKKELVPAAPAKSWKGIRFRVVAPNQVPPPRQKFRKPTERELTEMLFRMVITVMPQKMPDDTRKCLFCHAIGDGVSDGPARLLNLDVDKWVHLNCALWSEEVYETVNGALMNIEQALQKSRTLTCVLCHRTGATLQCFKTRCAAVYHLQCAVKDECVFYKNKTLFCSEHVPKNDKENELTTLSVFRRVYINRDENRQVATVMRHADENHLMRVGSLIFLNVGQLLPHQFQNFHNANYIYPIGYKIIRFYWSMRVANKRCRYICSIHEVSGLPEFRVLVSEPSQEDVELRDTTAKGVWQQILEPMQALRKENGNINIFPKYISGEDLFGLTEPAIVRILESLPGIETLTDYKFKYGRNPLLELPLAVNPTGCARSEPRIRGQVTFKRPHTQRTAAATARPALVSTPTSAGEVACPYSKQFVHSKSSQYKKMKQEWRNNVYLARSKIAGLGLYATRDIERHTMVIEYIGEIIRSELSETREKKYQEKNRGIYMFRLDEDRVIDATLCGGLARYINHSCNPNCVAEIVEVDRDLRIIIFAKRRIQRGEELAYDYKFDLEDDQNKIPCLCGAPNCKKWMN